jgi:phospholipid/cholesterol/gamma-HCH transport system substrate-binding protein/paraquat-inducible protein B
MSRKANYYKIGVFVIIGFVIAVVGIVVFGAGKFFRAKIMEETYFNQSVQGLEVGAPVKLQGVQVGNVKEISFVFNHYKTTHTYVLVRFEVYPELVGQRKILGRVATEEERKETLNELIKKGLRLQLDSSGITGVAFLNFIYLDPKQYPPLKIDWEPEYVYIPSAPGTITVVTQAIENLTEELEAIDIKGITNKVDLILANTNKAIDDAQIATLSKDIRGLIGSLNTSTKNLNSIMQSKEVRQSLKDLSQTLANINTASNEFPKTVAGVNKSLSEFTSFTSNQQQEVEQILWNIKQTTENLRELTDTAKKYPSWLLFGNPPPRLDEVKK